VGGGHRGEVRVGSLAGQASCAEGGGRGAGRGRGVVGLLAACPLPPLLLLLVLLHTYMLVLALLLMHQPSLPSCAHHASGHHGGQTRILLSAAAVRARANSWGLRLQAIGKNRMSTASADKRSQLATFLCGVCSLDLLPCCCGISFVLAPTCACTYSASSKLMPAVLSEAVAGTASVVFSSTPAGPPPTRAQQQYARPRVFTR